jgi:hypothetical protein
MDGVVPTSDKAATIKLVRDNADAIVTWRYQRDRPQLTRLYERAVASQWNADTDLDWSTDVDLDRLSREGQGLVSPVFQAVAGVEGSPLAGWGDREFHALGIELLKARMSQFLHGEQAAMIVAAKIVETVPWVDAKYFAATQTIDEARHTEAFARYIHTKLGEVYPCNANLEAQIDALIEDARWDMAYLGMQIVIESLALATFSALHRTTREPLLKKLLRYVMADEARHVAFGIVTLTEFYEELSSSELMERQEFLFEATLRNQRQAFMPEVWERLDVPILDLLKALSQLRPSIGGSDPSSTFTRQFHAKLVPNVRKIGLLDANGGWLREKWRDAGLLAYEFADDTAADYESYDAVNQDHSSLPAPEPG